MFDDPQAVLVPLLVVPEDRCDGGLAAVCLSVCLMPATATATAFALTDRLARNNKPELRLSSSIELLD